MNENPIPFQPSASALSEAAIYTCADDVAGDPNPTTADKRAIPASWVSDAGAVADAPTLRRLDSGAVVDVGAIVEALRRLDQASSVVLRLPTCGGRPPDGDDPPPTPAIRGVP